MIDSPLENIFVTVSKPAISGTAAPNSTVTLYDNNTGLGTLIGTAKSDTSGAWSITPHLQNGTYSFSATSTAGLFTGPVSPIRNFTVDTIPPQLSITTPDSSAILNTARSIVSGVSSDITSVKSVTWGVDNETIKPAYGITKWSFRTGKLLDGPHVVQINATNSVGLVTTKSIFFISDNIPPTITITSPANNVILNHISAINGTASDNTLLSQVSISIDGGAQFAATYSSGLWTVPIISGLSNGIHTITAVAIDAAGNVKTSALSFTVDNNPPTVSVSYPASNAIINTASPIITGTSFDAETGVESISATIDGSYQTLSGTTNWTMDTSGLSQGSHTLVVTATDEAGNVATIARSFIVDSIPPALSILTPYSDEILDTPTPTVLGNASDDVSLSSVTWNIDGGATKTASGTTVWSFTTDKLSNGLHTIQVNATDEAGNVATATRIFSVDPAKLTLLITSPENNTGVNTDSIQVTGTATSSSEIPDVTWSVDGGATKIATGTTNWEFSIGMLSDGIHTIQVSAENIAGTLDKQTIVVTKDTHPPTVAITNPVDDTNLNHISSINGTASDDTAISSVAISIDGNNTENAIYSKGFWTMPVTLSTGQHNVYAIATDTAGNSVTSSTVYFLLMSNPTPTVPASVLTNNNTSNVPTSVLAGNTTTIGNPATQNGTQNGGWHFPGHHFEGNSSSFPSGSYHHHGFEGNSSSFSGSNSGGNSPFQNDNQKSNSPFQNDNQKSNSPFQNDNQDSNLPSHNNNQYLSHDTQNSNSHSSQSNNSHSSPGNSHSESNNSHQSSSNNSHSSHPTILIPPSPTIPILHHPTIPIPHLLTIPILIMDHIPTSFVNFYSMV